MTFAGTVVNGVIVLEGTPPLAEGTRVEVIVVTPVSQQPTPGDTPTLQNLLDIAGSALDMPADMAAQHDHYIHGTPKR